MKKVALEILVSTMNRTDLSFLGPMFPDRYLAEFHILVINQTTPSKTLKSNLKNIRVINSFDYGLSKSRNLALKNSIGEVALIADDDIIYQPDFDKTVRDAFRKYGDAGLVLFQMQGPNNQLRKQYSNAEIRVTSLRKIAKPSSVELALRPILFEEKKICFNESFGLGAEFQSGEENILLENALHENIPLYFIPKIIVTHLGESTGENQGSEQFIRALSASKYLKYGDWSKLWLLKFVFFLVRHKFILPSNFFWAYQIGWSAIDDSKEIFI